MRGLITWAASLVLAAAASVLVPAPTGLCLAVGIMAGGLLVLIAQLVQVLIKRLRHD